METTTHARKAKSAAPVSTCPNVSPGGDHPTRGCGTVLISEAVQPLTVPEKEMRKDEAGREAIAPQP